MNRIFKTLALALAAAATPAAAQQFTAAPTVVTPGGMGGSYAGPPNPGGSWGSLGEGNANAFDGYGVWQGVAKQLTVSRQTDLMPNTNTFRFFDTFTNSGPTAYTGQVTFYGDLGSDKETRVLQGGNGVFVSCRDAGAGCYGDPVLALVYGKATTATMTGDKFRAVYTLTLDPGQSASILNAAFLARTATGPDAASESLALATGQSLLAGPILDGLSSAQAAQIVNFDIASSAVPEPATWAMTILGFGLIGAAARRRRAVRASALPA